jgi:hypothetical protein
LLGQPSFRLLTKSNHLALLITFYIHTPSSLCY